MTVTELNDALVPVLDRLEAVTDAVQYSAQVTYGVIVAVGVVAGLILIYLLLRKF
jgi:hypothetical protein